MKEITFEQMVERLAKDGDHIIRNLNKQSAHLLHMAVGISGEAGELLDALKKHAVYDKELDVQNVIEELGDLEFYMQGLRATLGITREQTIKANMEKLSVRYKGFEYSNETAQQRADKALKEAVNN